MAFSGNTGVRIPGPVEIYRGTSLHTQVFLGTGLRPLHPAGIRMLTSGECTILNLFKSLFVRICCSILH
jgi:hypothetical protein